MSKFVKENLTEVKNLKSEDLVEILNTMSYKEVVKGILHFEQKDFSDELYEEFLDNDDCLGLLDLYLITDGDENY